VRTERVLRPDSTPQHPHPTKQQADPRARLQDLGARWSRDNLGRVAGLDLSETRVTDRDLTVLQEFAGLHQLNLRRTDVSDAALEYVAALPELEFLGLTGTRVSDSGLPRLGALAKLRFLTLGDTAVTDRGLAHLVPLVRLEAVNLKGARVTADGVATLRGALPACTIISDFEAEPVRVVPVPQPLPLPDVNHRPPGRNIGPGSEHLFERPRPLFEDAPAPRDAGRELTPGSFNELPAPGGDQPLSDGRPTAGMSEDELATAIRERLDDPEVLRAIADVYAVVGRPDEVVRILEAAADRAPADARLRYELALALAQAGDYHAALPHFIESVGPAAAHYNLGIISFEGRQFAVSRTHFETALRHDPALVRAHDWLAELERVSPAGEATSSLLSEEQLRGLLLAVPPRTHAHAPATHGIEIRPAAPAAAH
jgi:hypothetical protein